MSNENIRIRTTPNDGSKSVNIQINQKFDFIEILSLKISQEDAYRRFCSDYGVVVGRVTVNSGYGVPNAKVSIFIPITDEDKNDPVISGLYPYTAIEDLNSDGFRYNLLPKNNETLDDCFTETGSFFNKREFQDNDEALDIYCKYYKYTTVTNHAGDYMFFGIPNGNYLIHIDADISNIGAISQKPYDIIREGSNGTQFYSNSKFKKSQNLNTLVQIKSKNGSVNVIPFWGDTEQCNLGITRFDVDLATNIVPSAIFIGALFGDNAKNSVNKRCRPRANVGTLENMTTASGTIEMIRKSFLGEIERFDIDGGELIDDNGTWAYQIPMNLDYVITDEFGELIPTDDPNKGLPTRARVRFRIGMNATGEEAQERIRAKYLVPHNPNSWLDSDYNFDETTKDANFQDFYWNKIYTVSNHISRVQNTVWPYPTFFRSFVGLKNVDDSGPNNPMPFNKIDTTLNPLFIIICLIVKIIAIIIKILNLFIVPSINAVFYFLNKFILKPICKLLNKIIGWVCDLKNPFSSSNGCIKDNEIVGCEIGYLSYVLLTCSADESGKPYCIGCDKSKTGEGYKASFNRAKIDNPNGFFYAGSNKYNGWNDTSPTGDAGWVNCISLALADALDVFKFDFYNDWLNGSLYSYLIRYKVRSQGKGKEKFCEIDCESGDGTDNNKDGEPDNGCFTNYIIDTCTSAQPQGLDSSSQNVAKSANYIEVREGLIKKHKGQLYYAAYSKKSNYRLYATKIVCLGAVFECDWQGLPKLHQYLADTTYNRPPLVNTYYDSGQYVGDIMESGFDSPDNKLTNTQICNIDCLNLGVGSQQCNNIKRLCELGVNNDQDNRDDNGTKADFKILNTDVTNSFIRGMFAYVNGTYNPLMSNKIQLIPFDESGLDYLYGHKYYDKFRGIKSKTDSIWMYENSFYFYFGLLPGKTAITRLKTQYFPDCIRTEKKEMSIIINNIVNDSTDGKGIGSIDISVNGGIGPYKYEWEGPIINGKRISCCYDGETKSPCNNSTLNCTEGQPFSSLFGGTYTVTVSDSVGNIVTSTVTVGGFIGVECEVQPRPINSAGNGNVYIRLSNGTSPYNVVLQQLDANDEPIPTKTYTLPPIFKTDIGGTCYGACNNQPLPEGNYIMTVKDSGVTIKTECSSKFTILKPEALIIDVIHTSTIDPNTPNIIPKLFCNGNDDGTADVSVEGGTPPYTFEFKLISTSSNIWGKKVNTVISTSPSPTNLVSGTYKLTVIDLGGNTANKTFTIQEPPPIVVNLIKTLDVSTLGGDNGVAAFRIFGSNPPFIIELDGPDSFSKTVDSSGIITEFTNLPAGGKLNSDGKTYTYKPYKVNVTDVSGCTTTLFVNKFNSLTDNFIIKQDETSPAAFGLIFNDYVSRDYGRGANYDTINKELRYCVTRVDDTVYNGINVLRHRIIVSGRNWGGFNGAEYLYHVRIPTIDNNIDRFLIGNPNLNAERFQSVTTMVNGVQVTTKVSLGIFQNAKPYSGGWLKLDDTNSQDLSWGRALYVYAAYKNAQGAIVEKTQNIVIEISDNAQKDTFNVVKIKLHYDVDTGYFDGDTIGNFGGLDGSTGIYCHYNSTNNGKLIGEAGNSIIVSPESPIQ